MNKTARVYIAGHRGMVGSAILRNLLSKGFTNTIVRTSAQLDLRNQAAVNAFFEAEKPEFVFLAAAKVGGIHANNTYRADFIYENIMIQSNVIHAAYVSQVQKLVFLGSSCIYPKLAQQPMDESQLLQGPLEATNEPYAIAKIAGIKMCDAYRSQYNCNFVSAMPTNLYGPNDNYDLANSHVLPALLRKIHQAKISNQPFVEVWGSGNPKREFLHVDDMAAACIFLMDNYNESGQVNIGCGEDLSIRDLALLIKEIVGYDGQLQFDASKPDGTPRKLLDISKIRSLGWQPTIPLRKGIEMVYHELIEKNIFTELNTK